MQPSPVSRTTQTVLPVSALRGFLREHFFVLVAALTFFLLITAQTLWSTIHGDGAVYAWITKELATGQWLNGSLPRWDHSRIFAEHPYFFIYFAALFVKIFGDSDLILKIPNYIVAAASLFTVYKASKLNAPKEYSRATGLIAGYALLLNATYIIQISQPSLDPMAHLLSLVSALILIFGRSSFFAGLLMGAAFLTKGLELLPNLAALVLTASFIHRGSFKNLFRSAILIGAGVLMPVAGWLVLDKILWDSQWLSTYWQRQFVNRFFNANGADKAVSLGYLTTAVQVYFLELFIMGVWFSATDAWKKKRNDPLFIFFLIYCVFNIAAFLIIKKDSSQHVTGILVTGSVFVGEAVFDIWQKMGSKRLWAVPVSLLVIAFAYWSWFFINADQNPDMWTVVKNETQVFSGNDRLPVVVRDSTGESYGLYYTAQWYTKSDQVYFPAEADTHLIGREVVWIAPNENGRLVATKIIYQKGLF